jgi:TonB family protein
MLRDLYATLGKPDQASLCQDVLDSYSSGSSTSISWTALANVPWFFKNTRYSLKAQSTATEDSSSLTGSEVDPPEFVPVEQQPIPMKQVSPEYDAIARHANLEGTVWVKLLVDKKGIVSKALVMKSDNELFVVNALKAALQWEFKPALMRGGVPVAVWVMVPFRFRLNK